MLLMGERTARGLLSCHRDNVNELLFYILSSSVNYIRQHVKFVECDNRVIIPTYSYSAEGPPTSRTKTGNNTQKINEGKAKD